MSDSLFPVNPILIVDDEPITLESVEMVLNSEGINNIILCQDSREVKKILVEKEISIILSDLLMPFVNGEEILQLVADNYPEIPVIIITGVNDIETTVRCMKSSAYDYIVKPVDENRLLTTVSRAIKFRELQNEAQTLRKHLLSESILNNESFKKILTQNKKMISIFRYIESVAKSSQPVLITGETGVGKELFAEAIHHSSGREGNFVALNIAGLDENVFADTLFGHLKGAYTGADRARDGLVEMASGGTLFLDEIGDLKHEHQVKLLRLIEAREYFQLGADAPRKSNVRIVVATNRNLKEMSNKDGFRNDLYFRLSAHQIHIPALRERYDDLALLLDHFLEDAANDLGKKKPTPPPELVTYLSTYHFPGNIRELKALVFDAVANHTSKMLNMSIFKKYVENNSTKLETPDRIMIEKYKKFEVESWESLPTIKEITSVLIDEALKRTNGNQSIASRLLGITRQTLINYMKQKKIDYTEMIEIIDLHKKFRDKVVLDGVNLTIKDGETTVIIGRSGCGKSVLLKHILGLLLPDSGIVKVENHIINELNQKELYAVRRKFGFLFQGAALFDSMTVEENVGLALVESTKKISEKILSDTVAEKLELVGLPGTQKLKPSELSGGMKKRVGLARALVTNPQYILYDEPTTGLDPIMSDSIDALIKELGEKLKVTSIVVTHDMYSVKNVAQNVAMMHKGKIYFEGTPEMLVNSNDKVVTDFIRRTEI